jgi:hypothetical protein
MLATLHTLAYKLRHLVNEDEGVTIDDGRPRQGRVAGRCWPDAARAWSKDLLRAPHAEVLGRSGHYQAGQGGRGRTLSVSSLAPNLGPIWGEMGCPGEDMGLGQRWVRILAHRCPSRQKRIDGEDLGPALEMLLVGGPSWRKSDSRHEDVHDFFYDNLHIFMQVILQSIFS